MKQYLELLRHTLINGVETEDRTGTGTRRVFGTNMRFDLNEGFPLVTTKKMFFRGVKEELLWMLSGSTNTNDLPKKVRHWWSPWADNDGELGPIYGKQFRGGIDQVANVIDSIKSDPFSRRHVISLWNPADIDMMALPPCHGVVIQFFVSNDRKLSCLMHQRSGDMFIGVPVNIAFYALLTHMIAQVCDLKVGELVHNIGDTHIYLNHFRQVITQLDREPLELCKLKLNPEIKDIDDFTSSDIDIEDYSHHPAIKAKVSV